MIFVGISDLNMIFGMTLDGYDPDVEYDMDEQGPELAFDLMS